MATATSCSTATTRRRRRPPTIVAALLAAPCLAVKPTDLMKNPFPPRGELKPWRIPIVERMRDYCLAHPTTCEQERDVYEFGVFTGRALRAMSRFFNKTHAPCCHAIWGFDSFVGLPPDLPPVSHNRTGRVYKGNLVHYSELVATQFYPGAFSVSRLLDTPDTPTLMRRVDAYIDNPRVHLIPGFFNESLTPALPARLGMKPALYVDIDTDIYVSSYQALDWLCANRLIVPGTIIGYDDFKWGLDLEKDNKGSSRQSHQKAAGREGAAGPGGGKSAWDGEARAHREVLELKYGVKMSKLGKVLRADSFGVIVTSVPWATGATAPAPG